MEETSAQYRSKSAEKKRETFQKLDYSEQKRLLADMFSATSCNDATSEVSETFTPDMRLAPL